MPKDRNASHAPASGGLAKAIRNMSGPKDWPPLEEGELIEASAFDEETKRAKRRYRGNTFALPKTGLN